MGTWNISITGTGCHHNYNRDPKGYAHLKDVDAERLAVKLVAIIKEAGHTVHEAKFTFTSFPAENVVDSKEEPVDGSSESKGA